MKRVRGTGESSARPPSIELMEGEPAYRQISNQLRKHILEGRYPVGSKLPTVRDLAKSTGTSVFLVQKALSPLAREGLIERTPNRGTYVRRNETRLTSVGLYFGTMVKPYGGGFSQSLYNSIYRLLEERGIEVHLMVESRSVEEQKKANPKVIRAIQNSEIQAVIAAMLVQSHIDWLEALEVPLALATLVNRPSSVHYDLCQLFEVSLMQLKTRGARRVALVPGEEAGYVHRPYIEEFKRITSRLGLEAIDPVGLVRKPDGGSPEELGYRYFDRLWRNTAKPDGLLIFPDICASGVLMAIKGASVRVPEDLKLVIHRNTGVDHFSPLPADCVTVDIDLIAESMIQSLEKQFQGTKPETVTIPTLINAGY